MTRRGRGDGGTEGGGISPDRAMCNLFSGVCHVHRPECTMLRANWTKRLCSTTSLQRKSGICIDSCDFVSVVVVVLVN